MPSVEIPETHVDDVKACLAKGGFTVERPCSFGEDLLVDAVPVLNGEDEAELRRCLATLGAVG